MSSDDFIKVSHKRRNRKAGNPKSPKTLSQQLANLHILSDENTFDKSTIIRQIVDIKDCIASSTFFNNIQDSFKKASTLLFGTTHDPNKFPVKTFVCFGLGHYTTCKNARFQFALILCMQDVYNFGKIQVCEPALTPAEFQLLNAFGIEGIAENIEAKCSSNEFTLYYLPHCPKQLTNNLLWANWSLEKLEKSIILGNSFRTILESNTDQTIKDNAEYIRKVEQFVTELHIDNCFKYFDVFNDTAFHVFPSYTLTKAGKTFWSDAIEPQYSSEDCEYIKSTK